MSDTEASSKRAEANRRNAQKSTGPKTPEGKDRSRFNAIKHGMRARTAVLPGEDPAAFDARLEAWTASLEPRDEVEHFLVRRAVELSWQLERADRALSARHAEARFARFDEFADESDDVTNLGRRLFWDPRGPTCLYPHPPRSVTPSKKISWSSDIDDPDDPTRLVIALEGSALGCAWLIDRWTELRNLLERGLKWQPPDRFRAIRLLGRHPMEAGEDRRVQLIYRATWVMEPEQGAHEYTDVRGELDDYDLKRWKKVVDARYAGEAPEGEEWAKEALLELIDGQVAELEKLMNAHLVRDEHETVFDDTPESDRLRRYQSSCDRMLLRVLETLRKRHREADGPRTKPRRPKTAEPPAPSQPKADADRLLDALATIPATNEPNASETPVPRMTNEATAAHPAPWMTNEATAAHPAPWMTNEATAAHPAPAMTNEANAPDRRLPASLIVVLALLTALGLGSLAAAMDRPGNPENPPAGPGATHVRLPDLTPLERSDRPSWRPSARPDQGPTDRAILPRPAADLHRNGRYPLVFSGTVC